MKIIAKAVVCAVVFSMTLTPVFAKGGRGGGGRSGGSKSHSYSVKSSTPKPTTSTQSGDDISSSKVNYRFGRSSGSRSSNQSDPCRQHGGFSHCEVSTGKYVCQDKAVITGSKACR